MAKGKPKTIDVVTQVVSLLEPLESAERERAIRAALTILGEEVPQGPLAAGGTGGGRAGGRLKVANEKAFFEAKEPNSKIEEFAVAARYREENENTTTSTRADLQRVIRAARRNFDTHNFKRDLNNARRAGLFTRGTGRDSIELSHYGQNYVEALPDREAVKNLRKPKGGRRGTKKRTGRR